MIKRLAGSLTLIAGVMLLLGLPLVVGAASNVGSERFLGLMLAALVACCSAIVLACGAQYLVWRHGTPSQSPQAEGARTAGRDR